jgi:D-alanine transaminase
MDLRLVPVGGKALRLAEHLARLKRSLAAIGLTNPIAMANGVLSSRQIVQRNGRGNLSVYFQVTRESPSETTLFHRASRPRYL